MYRYLTYWAKTFFFQSLPVRTVYYFLVYQSSLSKNSQYIHALQLSDYDRVKSGIFGQRAKFGQRPCLFHISNIGIKLD